MTTPGAAVPVDPFREALARWASGVSVVAVDDAGTIRGLTVSSFAAVSLSPPLILVCIREDSRFLRPLLDAGRFSVNLLTHEQSQVSRTYAGRQSHPARFLNGGVPILVGALVTLACRTWQTLPGGDHRIVVGEVEKSLFGVDERPLVYYRREYTSVAGVVPAAVQMHGGAGGAD